MRHTLTLSEECALVLRHLHAGGRVVARRTYPHPHRYRLIRPPDPRRKEVAEHEYATDLALVTVSTLIRHGLIANAEQGLGAHPTDYLVYRITDAGRIAHGQGGAIVWEDENAELFAGAVVPTPVAAGGGGGA